MFKPLHEKALKTESWRLNMYLPACGKLNGISSFQSAQRILSGRYITTLALCAGLLAAQPTSAGDTTINFVSSVVGSGAGDWSNPGNVVGPPDNNCANMGAVDKANLTFNFDFNIPLDATITGATAFIKAGEQSDQNIGVQLALNASVDPPTTIGDQRNLLVNGVGSGSCSATEINSLGTTLADWGVNSLSPADVNTVEFGLVFTKLATSSIKVDAICLQITYETAEGGSTQQECFTVPPAETNTVSVVKEVVGTPPDSQWAFTGTGDLGGNFTLPAAGGFFTAVELADDTYTITETPKDGYTVTSECFIDDASVATGDEAVSVTVAEGQFATCVFTNTLNSGSFTVNKDFSDNSDASVSIELTCTEGTVTESPLSATEASPAVFEVTGFLDAPTCTATEVSVPTGYTMDNSDCQDDDPLGGSCTIVNNLRTTSFTVNKTYNDGGTDPVTVNLVCTSGNVTTNNLQAAPGSPAVFEVTGWTQQNPSCTATESNVPAGYTADNTSCVNDTLVPNGSCTIANTANTGTFTVRKLYTAGTENPVSVTATCTSPAIVTNNPQMASPSTSAEFDVTRVVPGVTTCTATEVVPPGYEADESDCQDGDPIDGGCAITNSPLARATFRVTKDFTDDNPSEVLVAIDCNTGLILDQTKLISEGDDVVFVVTDYEPGELNCDISEEIPAGYSPTYSASVLDGQSDVEPADDDSGCQFDSVVTGGFQCSIVNTPDPVDVVIDKVWVIEGSGGDGVDTAYELKLYCEAEIVDGSTKCGYPYGDSTGSEEEVEAIWCKTFEGDDSNTFTGQVIPEYPNSNCWVKEKVLDSSVEIDNGCLDLVVSAGQGDSCVVTNTVFFEGIPTLGQYGKVMLVMLMLGMGIMGYRRIGS